MSKSRDNTINIETLDWLAKMEKEEHCLIQLNSIIKTGSFHKQNRTICIQYGKDGISGEVYLYHPLMERALIPPSDCSIPFNRKLYEAVEGWQIAGFETIPINWNQTFLDYLRELRDS